jgi:hypothetical protein
MALKYRAADWRAGLPVESFTADEYRQLVAEIDRRHRLHVAAPLSLPAERTIALDLVDGFMATLSGSSSPYSFQEVYGKTGGTWADRVRTGTGNAYEVNSIANLGGKTAWLEPGFPGDYRFQWVAGPSTPQRCHCSGIPDTLFLTIPAGAATFWGLASTLVTLTWTATPGAWFGPCMSHTFFNSSGGIFSVFFSRFILFCAGSTPGNMNLDVTNTCSFTSGINHSLATATASPCGPSFLWSGVNSDVTNPSDNGTYTIMD